jgi:hypothetical protein
VRRDEGSSQVRRKEGRLMGPHRDWVVDMNELVKSHPTLTWIPGRPHVATWDEDDGAHVEKREDLPGLVMYLEARLGRGHARR